MKNFLKKRVDVKFKQEQFSEETLTQGLNALSYGTYVAKHYKKGKKEHKRFFYILEDDTRFLQWISPAKPFTKSRIHLGEVKDLTTEVHWPGLNKPNALFLRIQTNLQELVLEFDTKQKRDEFYAAVQYFALNSAETEFLEKRQDQVKHLAQNLFISADKDGSKQLNIEETKRLLQELHINIDRKYLTKLFDKYDINKNGQIDQSEFLNVIQDISRKEELATVFKKYCGEYTANSNNDQTPLMTIAQFQVFQRNEQHQIFTTQEIADLFSFISMNSTNKNPKPDSISNPSRKVSSNFSKETLKGMKISFYEFSNFIFSQENSIFDPQAEEMHQSMDYPLSDYYVNSSHNTYLMANQLTSDSSCQAYINAFLNGCRCVEIDCWDGENGEPIVYHGHTLTSKIFFKDVIQTINEYAFRISLFPVVLSFENHCSLEQTKRMAEYLKDIFQDKLLIVPSDYADLEYYLSPSQLEGKIIVKSKGAVDRAVHEDLEMGYISESDEDEETESQSDLEIYEDIKNIMPDFTQNEQFVKNQENGKKKSTFLMKDCEEQKHILQMLSSRIPTDRERIIHSMKNSIMEKSQNFYSNNNGIGSVSGISQGQIAKSQGSFAKSEIEDDQLSNGDYQDITKELFSERAQGKVLEHLNSAGMFVPAARTQRNVEEKWNENQLEIIENLQSFVNLNEQQIELNLQEQQNFVVQPYKETIIIVDPQLEKETTGQIMIERLQQEQRANNIIKEVQQSEANQIVQFINRPKVLSKCNPQIQQTQGDAESLDEYAPETPMMMGQLRYAKTDETKDIPQQNQKQQLEKGFLSGILRKTDSNLIKTDSFLLPPPSDYAGTQAIPSHNKTANIITNTTSPRTGPALVSALPALEESAAPKITNLSTRNTLNPTGNGLTSKGTLKSKITLKKKETYEKKDTEDEENLEGGKKPSNKKKSKECKEFLQATGLFGCHMNLKSITRTCWQISSLSEVKYHRLLRSNPKELVELLKKSFIRLYPSALRVDSSNFDPIKGFLSGCQFVAMNFQTCDLPMLLNQSLFMQNGGVRSGYLLKPHFMLHNAKKTYCPNLMRKIIKIVKIKIISGQQLRPENYENDTFDVVDPYVQLFIKGTNFDEQNNKPQLTSVISDNGFHPIWDSDTFTFNFACPELAMLVFRTLDSDVGADTHLGSFAVPVDALRSGYRIIPLRKMADLQLIEHSFLLVKIDITEKILRPILRRNKSKK